MPAATFRFHGSLNDFLPVARRGAAIPYSFEGTPGVKDAIEALGVPHPEVDLVTIGGRPVGFGARLAGDDPVEVFPLGFRPAGLEAAPGLIPPQPRPPRFLLDGHLGRLARYLRMLGFDTAYDRAADDETLARRSAAEGRILLTRDRGLLKRAIVEAGYVVRGDDPRRQLVEVVERFGLRDQTAAFSRCIRCNGAILPAARGDVEAALAGEPRTLASFDAFGRCAGCGSIYWQGSHFDRMSRLVDEVAGRGPGLEPRR